VKYFFVVGVFVEGEVEIEDGLFEKFGQVNLVPA